MEIKHWLYVTEIFLLFLVFQDLNVVEAGKESDDGEEVFEDALDHLWLV